MNGDEQTETIEFYKIKLMEKDREISDFDSKLKKIEFKHNREVKEAKTAEERAKGLLKEEKAKVDKLSKHANENQQQNNLLQMRLSALKEEKEKEILEVRAQYNSIKEEVRSYERILPTHTFLTEINTFIDHLPTYEDIFTNLKEKIMQHSELNAKFDAYRTKMEDAISAYEQNEELLKTKKLEADRNLKDVLPKIIEYQHQISDFRISNEQHQAVINDLRSENDIEKSRTSSLEDSLREFEAEVEQMRQAFTNELHNKQEEVRLSFQEEMERYEQEIRSLSSRLEIKDNMYISQLHILEEETTYLHTKSQADKQKYEESLTQAREEIEALKTQLDKAKYQNEQIILKNQQTIRNLLQVASENDHLHEKIKGSEKKIQEASEIHLKQSRMKEEMNQSQLQEYQSKFDALNDDYKRLKDSYSSLLEERESMKEENQELRQEITNQKADSESHMPNNLDLPYNAFQYEEKYRRKSTDFDKCEQELIVMNTSQKQELNREKEKTTELIKKAQDIESEKLNMRTELEAVKHELNLTRGDIEELQIELSLKITKIQSLSNELSESKHATTFEAQKVKTLSEEKQKLTNESQQHKQKLNSLSKSLNESELLLANNNTKQNLLKKNIQSLQEEIKIVLEQDKKNKELIKIQKEELKTSKQALSIQIEKNSKEVKELSLQIESLKQEREQIKSQFASKEKSLTYEIAVLKNNKQLEEKLKSQMARLNEDLAKSEEEKSILAKKYTEMTKEHQLSKKEIQKLELENIQKDRENELINLSLDRERRERTLRTVPSLQCLQGEEELADEQNFNDIYLTITRKQGQINILQREISDLKEEIQSLRLAQAAKIEAMQSEQNEYIQTIILMKVKCAQSEMRASEKEYLYTQLKRKMASIGKF